MALMPIRIAQVLEFTEHKSLDFAKKIDDTINILGLGYCEIRVVYDTACDPIFGRIDAALSEHRLRCQIAYIGLSCLAKSPEAYLLLAGGLFHLPNQPSGTFVSGLSSAQLFFNIREC